ncbi:endoplasmic reticulum-based factor for assembly of V-ATPase-domain-containing protein [Xylaria acuta]|nr:endoplasmic reticulum-based factor for assembly of V-ATPase-domain-containing protein [Xylaria acuta]
MGDNNIARSPYALGFQRSYNDPNHPNRRTSSSANMVLLTMTPPMVEALLVLGHSGDPHDAASDKARSNDTELEEPCMKEPAVGNPISHGQILKTIKTLKAKGHVGFRLEEMLRGSSLYVPPPPPKPEPTDEYKALMARLRRDGEERSYERMLRKAPARETFAERFPLAPMAHSFAEVNRPSRKSDEEVDDVEFGDLQKQITLIVNFLVSVFGCGAALWKLAQWWPVSTRLFLSLGGAIVVAITEVAVYSAYAWRMSQGEKQQATMKEVREVVKTWVVGEEDDKTPVVTDDLREPETNLRRRIKTET